MWYEVIRTTSLGKLKFFIAGPTPASPGAITYPEGLVDTQHPAVPDTHPVVSARSQLSTCMTVHKGVHPPPDEVRGDVGGFAGQSICSRPEHRFLADT
jgi:hypothetical protein